HTCRSTGGGASLKIVDSLKGRTMVRRGGPGALFGRRLRHQRSRCWPRPPLVVEFGFGEDVAVIHRPAAGDLLEEQGEAVSRLPRHLAPGVGQARDELAGRLRAPTRPDDPD